MITEYAATGEMLRLRIKTKISDTSVSGKIRARKL
jgi:hypothetical protein